MIRPSTSPSTVATLILPYSTSTYTTISPPGYSRRRRGRSARIAVGSARFAAHSAAFLRHQISTGYRLPSGAYAPSTAPSGPTMPGWLATTIGVLVGLAIAQVFRG